MLFGIVSSLVGQVTSYRYERVVPPPPPPRLPPPLWSGAEAAHFRVILARDRQWDRSGPEPARGVCLNPPALMDVTARTFPGLFRLALLWVARLSVTAQHGRWPVCVS